MKRVFAGLAVGLSLCSLTVASSLLAPRLVRAQGGIVITGANDAEVLSYKLDFNGKRRILDRYRLKLPAQDVTVSEVAINFEEKFDGKVNPEQVRLEVEGEVVPIREVSWDPEFKSLEVAAEQPIDAGQEMRLVLSQVRNPRSNGLYRIYARVLGTEANPLYRFVGLWIVTIGNED
ncbi:MAG: DUF2808 domain-containing protein [Cyanobacteria bacterium J06642_2]